MALWGVIQGQNNRGSFRVIGSLRIMNSGSVRVIQVVIQGRLGLQLTASYFGLPVRVSGTNLALARVRGWGKGSNYLKSSCVRGTRGSFRVIHGHSRSPENFQRRILGGQGHWGSK